MVVGVEKPKMRLACNEVLAPFSAREKLQCSRQLPMSDLFVTWHGMIDNKFSELPTSNSFLVPG